MRRVLLVEPFFHVHSLVHFRAAVSSDGFEDARFVIATGGIGDRDRERVLQFAHENSRVELRELGLKATDFHNRWQSWRGYAEAVRLIEEILRSESFDFFAYLMFDNALPCFALPGARSRLRAHFSAGVRGLLLRDNGLRPFDDATLKEKLRALGDRMILGRALRSGAIRKLAFYDHRSADLARAMHGEVCGYGIDPIERQPSDPFAARVKLGFPADAWVALMFGVISARKGVVETLEALAAAKMDLSPLLIVLAGPVEADIRSALETAVEKARSRFRVVWKDQFVPDADVTDYFAAADCVICAYKRFNASSGVLLHGAAHGKPAIVSRGGVMHDAILQFGFGKAVDLDDPPSLAAAVNCLMNLPASGREAMAEGAQRYAASMDARKYMTQFI